MNRQDKQNLLRMFVEGYIEREHIEPVFGVYVGNLSCAVGSMGAPTTAALVGLAGSLPPDLELFIKSNPAISDEARELCEIHLAVMRLRNL